MASESCEPEEYLWFANEWRRHWFGGYGLTNGGVFGKIYMGKHLHVEERAASLDHCPWCSAKGLTYLLRSYHINLQESITLCTNPQCLFPLVSRPLEDVLASLVPVEPATGNKRKSPPTLVADEPSKHSPKRLRVNDHDYLGSQLNTHHEDVHSTVNSNGQREEAHTQNVNENIDSPVAELSRLDSPQQKDIILEKDSDVTACLETASLTLDTPDLTRHSSQELTTDNEQVLSSYNNTLVSDTHKKCNQVNFVALDRTHTLQGVDISPNEKNTSLPQQNESTGATEPISLAEDTSCSEIQVIQSDTKDLSSTKIDSEELVSAPTELFWSNRDSLCWLDSLLVALVNLRNLRRVKPKDEPRQSPVCRLVTGFDEACATIQAHHRTDGDGSLKVPYHMLHKVNKDLETLRMSVFSLLQPTLHCKLGQKETPVFALPLLLKMDPWLEPLFQSTFHWDFKCTECKSTTKENLVRTLSTFTNIVPDWHPLGAVHLAPCNVCCKKNQRRRMVLEGVAPVFALHFVEGLPDNNTQIYSFNFNRKHYSVTAIIQYNNHLKHFVTWICKSDGSWVEFDDLKHPHCKIHKKLPVPAQEIHVVFWEEEEERQGSRACSPSSTFTECPPSTNEINRTVTDLDIITEDLLQCSPDQSLLNPQSDTDVMCPVSEQDTTAGADTSIGSTTLLDAFEGLTHNDIVTLTLVELKGNSKSQPSNGNDRQSDQTEDLKCPDLDSVIQDSPQDSSTPTPDSSSTVGAVETPEQPKQELSSDYSDPTFVPETRQNRDQAAAAKTENAPKSDVIPKVTQKSPVSTVQSEPTTSLVTSTIFIPQAFFPAVETQPEQKGWSELLKRSFGHILNTSAKISPTEMPSPLTKLKPPVHFHSTPKPLREPVPAKAPLPPLLKKDDPGGLPLKAAEMYGAFGSKNLKSPTVNQDVFQNQKTPNAEVKDSLICTTVAGVQQEITSSKKNKSSKIPPGLSETEALRYKLMKKLKAKKKKLVKLNEMLGPQGDGSFRPDSTDLDSPNTVTSSTFDGSTCDEFLSDLLSPATTASHLSPDSTGFMDMFANGQEAAGGEEMQTNAVVQGSTVETDNFLDEFISQAVAERPTEMEAEALSALELFF